MPFYGYTDIQIYQLNTCLQIVLLFSIYCSKQVRIEIFIIEQVTGGTVIYTVTVFQSAQDRGVKVTSGDQRAR